MRIRTTRPWILAAIPVALAAFGCNSTQPDQVTSVTASLAVTAFAVVDNNDCWEVWFDTDDNGQPDLNSGQIYCEPVAVDTKVFRRVPWGYSLVISVLRAGETTQELIASSVIPGDGIPDFVSVTPYDETVQNALPRQPDGGVYFLNGKRVSNGSAYYQAAMGFAPVQPNVLRQTPTYDFSVNPGDTIIVQARKQLYADGPSFLNFDQDPELTITGDLTVAGVRVQVNGESTSPGGDGAGFSFSFTRK